MDEELYRFRTTSNLLDGFSELENQEIYFAPPEQLNDPLEGFKDMFWQGDGIVWKNLLKHYLLSLKHCFSFMLVAGDIHLITAEDIPVLHPEKLFTTLESEDKFQTFLDSFFESELVRQLPEKLAARKGPIRRIELIHHLRTIHQYALELIYDHYNYDKIKPVLPSFPRFMSSALDSVNLDIFDYLNELEDKHRGGDDRIVDKTLLSVLNNYSQLEAIYAHVAEGVSDRNSHFLFISYPESYVNSLERILYWEWFAACFMSKYDNSSLWGHYGEKHKGVCLIFNVENDGKQKNITLYNCAAVSENLRRRGGTMHCLHKINYDKKPVEIDFFRSIGRLTKQEIKKAWYESEQGQLSICAEEILSDVKSWGETYWKNFIQSVTLKTEDWENEGEYRLILTSDFRDYSEPKSRKLRYNFSVLKGIIFGIKTSVEDKNEILKIIKRKCQEENRKDFKFYQAYYSPQGGIERAELTVFNQEVQY